MSSNAKQARRKAKSGDEAADKTGTTRIGRPREFDRERGLENAMELFWRNGYEGTTLLDLQQALGGITASSLYAAYGTKEQLFKKAVELYRQRAMGAVGQALFQPGSARDAVEAFLRAASADFTMPGKPRGCMLVLGAMNCSAANEPIGEHMRSLRMESREGIRARIALGVAEGNVPAPADVEAMAAFYAAFAHGISIEARDGTPRAKLLRSVDIAMAAWDGFLAAAGTEQSPSRPAGRRASKHQGM